MKSTDSTGRTYPIFTHERQAQYAMKANNDGLLPRP